MKFGDSACFHSLERMVSAACPRGVRLRSESCVSATSRSPLVGSGSAASARRTENARAMMRLGKRIAPTSKHASCQFVRAFENHRNEPCAAHFFFFFFFFFLLFLLWESPDEESSGGEYAATHCAAGAV